MRTEKEIRAKKEELNERMSKVAMFDSFSVASIDAQRYILDWVLEIET